MGLLHSFVKLQTSSLFMKLKNTNIIALRILAIAASIISAHAAVVNVTTSNFTSGAGSFPDTINANAGGATSVTIVAGSFITGDAAATSALNVNVTGYTTFNSGTLQGNGAAAAATVAATTTINNQAFATIRSTTNQGINITAGTGSIINNSNLIEGGADGISSATNTLTVKNLLAISEIKPVRVSFNECRTNLPPSYEQTNIAPASFRLPAFRLMREQQHRELRHAACTGGRCRGDHSTRPSHLRPSSLRGHLGSRCTADRAIAIQHRNGNRRDHGHRYNAQPEGSPGILRGPG